MLSKIFKTGKSFGETCAYVCLDLKRSVVLAVEGVRGHDHKLMAEDFATQQQFMPEKVKPVFHGVLSFPHGEIPGDQKMVEIAKKYLEEIRVTDTQYALIKHTDKEHLHLHILANRVDNEGKPTGKGLIIERGIEVARKLTKEYGLRPETGKHLSETNMEALHEPDAQRYRLYEIIRDQLPEAYTMEELEKRLLEKGVSTRYRNDPETQERVGVSFRIGNRSFKGSRVDEAYSVRNLEQTLALQQEQNLRQKLEREGSLKQEMELRARQVIELRKKFGIGTEAVPEKKVEQKQEIGEKPGKKQEEVMREGQEQDRKLGKKQEGAKQEENDDSEELRPRLRLRM